ncbi:PhnA domain protein, partial [Rhizobium leguminosarum]
VCAKCRAQLEKKEELDSKHWNCLTEAMWSEVPAVQVVSWRMLNRLRNESWAADNLDMLYLDEEKLAWAKASGDHENDASVDLHKDCNG